MSARNRPAARSGGTIRGRVVRTLTLPVAAVLVLLGVISVIEIGGYRAAGASARAVTLVLSAQDLVQELQTERGLTAGLLGGNAGFRSELAPARRRVDDRRAAVEKLLSPGDAAAGVIQRLDGLAGVREGVDAGGAGRNATFAFYTARIADLTGTGFGLDSSADPALRGGAAALTALADVKESTAQERALLNGVFSAGGFQPGEFLQFVTMRSAKDAGLAEFTRHATATQRAAKDYVLATGAALEATAFEQLALGAGDGRHLQVNPQSWWSALTTVLDDMLRLEQHVGSVIRARAADLRDRATRRMALLLGAVLICFGGSVYLAVVASRSIARPLAVLAAEANHLAGDRLPDAVRRATAGDDGTGPPPRVRPPDGASDEVRLVADALDRVQATAYALATGQARQRHSTAESLANLGRRNQNLLRRQLGFITGLEREESDPTGLANLFELDHLATRMRRNAESLLVLVGAASPRQWADPLPVTDVVRAAVSEVEEYRRVALRRVDEAQIAGAVVSGLAHMLAELIENGLAFSPPDADVEIQGRRVADGYLIAITDQGVGMNRADLELANQRLRGEGDFVTAPARFLGHYVVGRLAADMDIDVQLGPSPVTGVTARIVLPAALLAPAAPAVEAPPARPATAVGAAETRPGPRVKPTRVDYVTVPPARLPIEAAVVPAGPVPVTPNGLRKRIPRARHAGTPAATATRTEDRPAPVSDSPDDVRARLTAFRTGMRGGTAEIPRIQGPTDEH